MSDSSNDLQLVSIATNIRERTNYKLQITRANWNHQIQALTNCIITTIKSDEILRIAAAQQVRLSGEGGVHHGRVRDAHTATHGHLSGRARPPALPLQGQQEGQQARTGHLVRLFGKPTQLLSCCKMLLYLQLRPVHPMIQKHPASLFFSTIHHTPTYQYPHFKFVAGRLPVDGFFDPAAGHVLSDNADAQHDAPARLHKSQVGRSPGRAHAAKVPVHPQPETGAQPRHRGRTHAGPADVQGRGKLQGHMLRRRRYRRMDSRDYG